MSEDNTLLAQRRDKAEELETSGTPLYPNGIPTPGDINIIVQTHGETSAEALEANIIEYYVAGRIMGLRRFGKAAFMHIQDNAARIQVHVTKDGLGDSGFNLFKKIDLGDIIAVRGRLFRTKTGELTIAASNLQLASKSLRPLPEKFHGLKDKETRNRKRYLDMIMNPEVKRTFEIRARIVRLMRQYFHDNGFLEVETPMMQPIVGGATAKPFQTHHNALGIDLFLRIAPELYLKRLLVGGFNRVFELNRNFRNEGISIQHNPEFTMLEFYEAYATFEDLIKRTESLFSIIADDIHGSQIISYQGHQVDLTPPWRRLTFEASLCEIGGLDASRVSNRGFCEAKLKELGAPAKGDEAIGKLQAKLFDLLVEPNLIQPTFITHYPTDISPLARKNAQNPEITDRFEMFITGREMANAFSELNDPRDQKMRFEEQIATRGDDEEIPPELDEDYIEALEHAMPPAAGEGIGIDRLVMLFTDSPSIRDVILFPLLKPEAKGQVKKQEESEEKAPESAKSVKK